MHGQSQQALLYNALNPARQSAPGRAVLLTRTTFKYLVQHSPSRRLGYATYKGAVFRSASHSTTKVQLYQLLEYYPRSLGDRVRSLQRAPGLLMTYLPACRLTTADTSCCYKRYGAAPTCSRSFCSCWHSVSLVRWLRYTSVSCMVLDSSRNQCSYHFAAATYGNF